MKAKDGGKKIEEIRSRIKYHKDAIEKLRGNHAISVISRSEDNLLDEDNLISQEMFHSDAINKEKIEYNDTLEYLRKLKGNIEHSQKAVEKVRAKMQADFDVWYREMCSRERSLVTHRNNPVITTQPPLGGNVISSARVSVSKAPDDTSSTTYPTIQHQRQQVLPVVAEKKREEQEFQLPPGVKLTGNKEADDDIIAFFKAKQVLLSRSSLLKK